MNSSSFISELIELSKDICSNLNIIATSKLCIRNVFLLLVASAVTVIFFPLLLLGLVLGIIWGLFEKETKAAKTKPQLANRAIDKTEPIQHTERQHRRRKKPQAIQRTKYVEVKHSKRCQIDITGTCTCKPKIYFHYIPRKYH